MKVSVEIPDEEMNFCLALASGVSKTRSATLAGYSVACASTLLRKPGIRATLEAMRDNITAILKPSEARETVAEEGE